MFFSLSLLLTRYATHAKGLFWNYFVCIISRQISFKIYIYYVCVSDISIIISNLILGFNLLNRNGITSKTAGRIINRLRTGHDQCAHTLQKWGMLESQPCSCEKLWQTLARIVEDCSIYSERFEIENIHNLTLEVVQWLAKLEELDIWRIYDKH